MELTLIETTAALQTIAETLPRVVRRLASVRDKLLGDFPAPGPWPTAPREGGLLGTLEWSAESLARDLVTLDALLAQIEEGVG